MATALELSIATVGSGVDATDLAEAIFGAGIQVVSATYYGDPNSAGIYTGADSTIPGITGSDGGVILSTGNAATFTNSTGTTDTNTLAGAGIDSGGVDGDPLLDAVSGYPTFDASILEAEFIPEGDMLTMQFVFSSEEYLEYVNGGVNDAFGVWVNGVLSPVTISLQRVTIDTVNGTVNENLYIDNPADLDLYNTEMDGFTVVLSVKAPVTSGEVNTIRIGIADGGDSAYDSNVLIMANSVQTYALAIDDQIQQTAGTSRTFDLLANDRDLSDQGLTITQINGTDISVGQTVTLPTGQQVTLNADGTVTITSPTVGSDIFTYEVTDTSGNTDIGFVTLTTTATPAPDGIVEGTSGADVIDATYVGDPDGDLINANDATGVAGTTGDGDYILAGAGNDSIVAGDGNDIIYAGADNDTVFGGLGDDRVWLGAGNDSFGTYQADSGGNDTVYGEAGNDFIITGAADDVIYGGIGDDTLSGGIGSDTLFGGAGQDNFNLSEDHEYDSIVGGTGNDTIWFGNFLTDSGVTVTFSDNQTGTYAYDLTTGNGDFQQIEAVSTTEFNDVIDAGATTDGVQVQAGAGDDQIFGGSGNDLLEGDAGQDFIQGGAGDDSLYGGAGTDTLEGGDGNDTISDTDGQSEVYAGAGDDVVLTWNDDDNLIGDAGNDILSASGGNDFIDGGSGADTIYGGTGNDTIFGGSETLIFPDPSMANYVQVTSGTQTITGTLGNPDFTVTSTSNEGALDFTTYGPITDGFFIGNADGEEIHTHSFDTQVFGAQIVLNGTNIGETLSLSIDGMLVNLNDAMMFGLVTFDDPTGTYVIDGNGRITSTSNDAAVLEATTATLTINQSFTTLTFENNGGVGGSVYSLAIDSNPGIIVVSDEADLIVGGDGNDEIVSGQGNDTVFGGADNDSIFGQEGADSLLGEEGADLIYAGDGDDTIDGGLDGDAVFGGAGNDLITDQGGNDYIDADIGNDTAFGGSGDDVVHGSEGADLVYGEDGNDSVMGGYDSDTVYGGAGADLLMGHGNIVNLLQNGSFEDTTGMTVTPWGFRGDDGTAPGGWVAGPGGVIDIHNSGAGIPTDGTNWLDTEGMPGVTTISQTLSGVIDGTPYRIEFDAVDVPSDDNGLNVYWNGQLVGTVDPGTGFTTRYVFDVTGGSGDGSNTLTFEVTGPTDGAGVQIDSVGVWGASSLIEDTVADSLFGGDDADTIYGGGNDVVDGGEGGTDNDLLIVRDVDQITYGGSNNEAGTILFLDGSVLTFQNIEAIEADGTLYAAAPAVVDGTLGDDAMGAGFVDAQGDQIDGTDGLDDTIYGFDGADTIEAGLGNDEVYGGLGNDVLSGGAGSNLVDGDDGDDTFVTGAGADTFVGGSGQDNLDASGSAAAVNIDLNSGVMTGGDVGNDSLGFGVDGVIGSAFDDTLSGFDDFDPTYTNQLFGGAGNDLIDGRGGDDLLEGGSGNDTIFAGTGNDTVDGGSGDDSISAFAGNNSLSGGDGADTIFSQDGGNDTIFGGADNDTITIRTLSTASVSGGETVTTGTDQDRLDVAQGTTSLSLTFSGAEAGQISDGPTTISFDEIEQVFLGNGNDTINTGAQTAGLYVDAGGGNDLFDASTTSGDNVLEGQAGDDTIYGGSGNETLGGGAGSDLIYGAAGSDSLRAGGDDDTVYGGIGHDTIDGAEGNDLIEGGDGNDSILGGTGADTLIGGAGADSMQGGGDADTFVLNDGFGNDTIGGGETAPIGTDSDRIDASSVTSAITVNFLGNENGTLINGSDTLTFAEIETFVLTASDDLLTAGADSLGHEALGGGGNDTLLGGSGNDTYFGGIGADSLGGGDGDDRLYGGEGNDTLVAGNNTGLGDQLFGGAGNDVLTDSFWNATLDGGDGADLIYAGYGDAVIYGGSSGSDNDTLSFALADDTVNITVTGAGSGSFADDDGDTGTFTGIESFVLTSGADTVDASASSGAVHITGGAGNDLLIGGAGADTLLGGNDADIFFGHAGDSIVGGEGGVDNDTLVLNSADVASITYGGGTNEAGTVNFLGGGTLTFSQIETIIYTGQVDGTAGNDAMTIGFTDVNGDQIDGSDGINDLIFGYGGNDTIDAGLGDDTVYAGTGFDTVYGGAGNDLIYLEDGSDRLLDAGTSGAGNDTVYGGLGNDTLQTGAGDDVVYGGDGNESINGGAGSDTLYGGADADYFNVNFETELDVIFGGETGIDQDTIVFTSVPDGVQLTMTGDGAGTYSFVNVPSGFTQATGTFAEIETLGGANASDTIDASADSAGMTIYGYGGSDSVIGGSGADLIDGGGGNDTISVQDNFGQDTLRGGETFETTGDVLDASGLTVNAVLDLSVSVSGAVNEDGTLSAAGDTLTFSQFESFVLGAGADTVTGSTGNDSVSTGAGNDFAEGGAGNDTFDGGEGADLLYGGDGTDNLSGGDQSDTIFGGSGGDGLSGGLGNDTVYGGADNDLILGGGGADALYGDEGDDALFGSEGNDTLYGGTGNDSITGNDGNDWVQDGQGNDTVYGGQGLDTIDGGDGDDLLFGGLEDDFLLGGNDQDTLQGDEGNDTLWSGEGDDRLIGGAGNDSMSADGGDDTFVLSDGFGLDQIVGGETTEVVGDTLDATGMTAGAVLDLTAGDPGNPEQGTLTQIGTPGHVATFAEIENILLGTGADSVIGSAGNDVVATGAGADTVDGGAGNDSFDLGVADSAVDVVRFADGDGDDTIQGFEGPIDNGDGTYSGRDLLDVSGLTDGVGNLVNTADVIVSDDGFGNAVLTFPNLESLTLIGVPASSLVSPAALAAIGIPLSGADGIVDGTSGNDTMDVGFVDVQGDQIDGVDGLNDEIYGYDGADSITAGDGADLVYGGLGNDTIEGGAGGDHLYADQGDNTLFGGDGDDHLDDVLGSSYTGSNQMYGGAGQDTIFSGDGADTVYGGDDADNITAEAGADLIDSGTGDDTVYGGQDADTIQGMAGNDLLYGDEGADSLFGWGDSDTLYGGADNDMVDGDEGDDSLFGGLGDDTLVGDAGADSLNGGDGLDQLFGGVGNDTFDGGDGADQMSGGDDADLFFGGSGDVIDGGEGGLDQDVLVLSDVLNVVYGGGNNEAGTVTFNDLSTLTFANIETLQFGGRDGIVNGTIGDDVIGAGYTDTAGDQIDGNDALLPGQVGNDDIVQAGDGNDSVEAGLGNDAVFGGDGSDSLYGGSDNDSLDGGNADDSLFGGDGDDSLAGGAGRDSLEGGAGNDTLFSDDGESTLLGGLGNDQLFGGADFDILGGGDGDDLLDGAADNDVLDGGAGLDTLYGGTGDDLLLGEAGNDSLFGGDGADTVEGGDGADILDGGAGADTFFGGADQDTIIGDIGDVVDGGNTGTDEDVLDLTAWGKALTNVHKDAGNSENGFVEFLDAGGAVIGTLTFTDIETVIPCFTPGCLIMTLDGEVPVEDLEAGDMVMTRDHGYRPIRWVGRRDLGAEELAANPAFAPVCIPQGAFGADMPERDLVVSPQHRILMHGAKAEILFGEHEVLVAATHLVGFQGVHRTQPKTISYIHILFDEHEIVRSDGAWTESFQPGDQTMGPMHSAQRAEILALFPELAQGMDVYGAARRSLRAFEAKAFLGARS